MKRSILRFLILIALSSCFAPDVRKIEFEKEYGMVIGDLQELGGVIHADFEVSARLFNGKEDHTFLIKLKSDNRALINDEMRLNDLCEKAFRIVTNSISNENDYDRIVVEVRLKGESSPTILKTFQPQTIKPVQ